MLNKAILQGRVTDTIDLKSTQTGKYVTSFNIAVERNIKGADGQRTTDFIPVVAWGGTAEFAHKYFTKGQQMLVVGEIQVRKWTDQNGGKRYSTEINANDIYFCGGKNERSNNTSGDSLLSGAEMLDDDEDLPF